MYKHILIPIDGSDLSNVGLEAGLALAKALDAPVTVLTVSIPFHVLSMEAIQLESARLEYELQAKTRSGGWLIAAADKAKALGVRCTTQWRENEHPYRAIVDTAQEEGCDLITMSSHGRSGVTAALLGSETQKVLAHSKVPVLVYR